VAREVWQGDGAVVMHLNGEVYSQKPPLFFWLVAASQRLAGSATAAASRIPSALATLLTALLLYGMVHRTHGRKEALAAAVVLLCSVLVVQMGCWVGIDALVMVLVTACVHLQVENETRSRFRSWRVAGIAVLAASIVLAKVGPVFIALVALGGGAVLARGRRGLLPRHLLWSIPLFLGVLALWVLPAAKEGGWDYISGLSVGQAGKRLVTASSHGRPAWYYLVRFPLLLLPFAVLIPAIVLQLLRERREGGEPWRRTLRYVLWFVLPFLIFTIVSGKRERYLLPLYPAAAALAGIALVRLRGAAAFTNFVRRPLVLVLSLLGLTGGAVAAAPFLLTTLVMPRVTGLPEWQLVETVNRIQAGAWILIVGGLSAVLAVIDGLIRRRDDAPATPVAAAWTFLVFALSVVVLPALDSVKSYEPLVDQVRMSAPEAEIGISGLAPGPFCLALRSDRVPEFDRMDPAGTVAALRDPARDLVVIVPRRDLDHWGEDVLAGFEVVAARQVGRRFLVALRRL
jgi:4-amino-4-deoxy-L-arabinose transferase-like glycosyltransferase